MPQCGRTENLKVHYKRKNGGNELDNAIVLCDKCYKATLSNSEMDDELEFFTETTKMLALVLAHYRCECTSNSGCH